MSNKLCIIYNTAPRYREEIFRAIDKEYECDWYFGPMKMDIKEMDTSLLKRVTYYNTYGDINQLYWKRAILNLLFKKKYQIFFMLTESRSLTDYVFLWVASTFFPKKRIYIWTHGWYGKESKLESKMKLWMFRHVSGIYLYGNYAKTLLVKHGIPENKLFVIHNSLHYNLQKKIRKHISISYVYELHFGNTNPVIIFIGRLTQVKRLDILINAVALLKKRGEYYNIVFVGDGVMRSDLELLTQKLALEDSIWFYGDCYNERSNAELLYNADLCVAPGNVGLTAIHAMSFGCPVISHNDFRWQMPEFEAIKSGITGDFFKRDNIQSLAETISGWFKSMRNKRDHVRISCFNEIDTQWNPYFQMDIIKKNLK